MTNASVDSRQVVQALKDCLTWALEDNWGDVHFYEGEEWQGAYGRGSIATMTFEGPAYQFIYYPTTAKQNLLGRINQTLNDMGLYAELGHTWSMHVYPIDKE